MLPRSIFFAIILVNISQLKGYILNVTQIRQNLCSKAYNLTEYKLYEPQLWKLLVLCL